MMTNDAEFILAAIKREVHGRIEAVVAEEIAEAQKRVDERIRKEIDSMALNILQYYDVSRREGNIVITVNKGPKP